MSETARMCVGCEFKYRGTLLIRNRLPLGPYSRTMPRALGGGAVSYERGTPVLKWGVLQVGEGGAEAVAAPM